MIEASSGGAADNAKDDKYAGFVRMGAEITISVDGKSFSNIVLSVHLTQAVNEHDRLIAAVVGKVEERLGAEGLASEDAAKMLGKPLTFSVKEMLNDQAGSFSWTGPVTDIRFKNTNDGQAVIELVAAGPTVVLDSGKQNAVYTDLSAADIVGRVVGKYSVSVGTKSASSSTFPYIFQRNESDYDFLQRVAAMGGSGVFYDGSKVQIKEPGGSSVATLKWGVDLASFSTNVG